MTFSSLGFIISCSGIAQAASSQPFSLTYAHHQVASVRNIPAPNIPEATADTQRASESFANPKDALMTTDGLAAGLCDVGVVAPLWGRICGVDLGSTLKSGGAASRELSFTSPSLFKNAIPREQSIIEQLGNWK